MIARANRWACAARAAGDQIAVLDHVLVDVDGAVRLGVAVEVVVAGQPAALDQLRRRREPATARGR